MVNRQIFFIFLLAVLLALWGQGCSWMDGSSSISPLPKPAGRSTPEAGNSGLLATSNPSPVPTRIPSPTPTPRLAFDGQSAWQDVQYQVDLGPRIPGSPGHTQVVDWMTSELQAAGWDVEVQETTWEGKPIRNVIARLGTGRPWVVLGAHYDSRIYADNDPDPALRDQPVPAANDGASGVAVLLEMARVLPARIAVADQGGNSGGAPRYQQVWLVFFDAEDNGRIEDWDWILGSQAFVDALEEKPDSAVVIDMIGDADLNIYMERQSNQELRAEIWATAAELGYEEQFIPQEKHSILDDHVPFLRAGIPAADLIDFDYPYWHTMADTPDKVSPESLNAVGDTLLAWLAGGP